MYDNNPNPRRKLADILDGDADNLRRQWNDTEAAQDFAPLPAATYECHIMSGELGQSRKGTPQYTIVFRVIDGEHANRQVWHRLYLTAAALPMAKRDLAKLAVTDLAQLEKPLPTGIIRCRVRVALRRDDDGTERNRVRGFDVLGIDEPERDPFAPADGAATDDTPDAAGENGEPAADADTSFDPVALDAQLENGAAGDDGKPTDSAVASRR